MQIRTLLQQKVSFFYTQVCGKIKKITEQSDRKDNWIEKGEEGNESVLSGN